MMLLELLEDILLNKSISDVAKELNLARGTVVRWRDLGNVPEAYRFDLMKIAGQEIDYSQFTYKQKDQFFTPVETARYCYEVFVNKIKQLNLDESKFQYIEPSAGNGSFLSALPIERTCAMDIEPKSNGILKQDYLCWHPSENINNVVFGNPPFGLRGHLALKFINHSYEFADFVCFILPQLFESDGKGVPRKRVEGYNLIHSEKIEPTFYSPDNKMMNINVVFQIWSKNHVDERYALRDDKIDWLKVYSLSDGGTPSSTRNKDMIGNCDFYLPSTCFGKENMRCYQTFDELPGRKGYGIVFKQNKDESLQKAKSIDWPSVAFLSTNSAYNLRTSKIIEVLA